MAITNPNILTRPIVSATGQLTAASQIILNDDRNAESVMTNLESAILQWKMNTAITDATNPGATFLALNNVDKDLATIISFNTTAAIDSARFDELLEAFVVGDRIYIQERDAANVSILYRVTGTPTVDGTKVNVPVEHERNQGPASSTFTNDAFLVVKFFYTRSAGAAGLPNQFLSEIEEVDRNVYTQQETEGGRDFAARFWLRDALVTLPNINDPGTGLRIDESNGDLADDVNQFQSSANNDQAYLYVALDDNLVASIANLWIRILDPSGNELEAFNMATNFTEQTPLTGGANGTIYLLTSGGSGGEFVHYMKNSTISIYTAVNDPFFDIPESNANDVDFTRTIKGLQEDQLADNVVGKLNSQGVPFDDQFKLDQLEEQTASSTSGPLTGDTQILYRVNNFSQDTADYFATTFDQGIPPSIGRSTFWYVAVPHNVNLESFTNNDGTTNVTLFRSNFRLIPSATTNNEDVVYNIYTITVPDAVSGTPTFLTPNGTEVSISQILMTSLMQIRRLNLDPLLAQDLTADAQLEGRVDGLDNKVALLYPLVTILAKLQDWASIFLDEQTSTDVIISAGYSLLADYRSDASRYESAGITYDAGGVDVVRYSGLSNGGLRAFGFTVTAAEAKVLMWLIDGSDLIPFIDTTVGGNIRVNNFTRSVANGEEVTNHFTPLSLSSGSSDLTQEDPLPRAEYLIPDFPAGSTNQSQTVEADFDVAVNGVNTNAGGIITFSIPAVPVEQGRENSVHTFNLGPLHNNRQVTVTIGHRLRLVPGYQLDFTLQGADADITLLVRSVTLLRNYTSAGVVTRTDNFVALGTASGTYTFSGNQEILCHIAPYGTEHHSEIIAVAVGDDDVVHQFNNVTLPDPTPFMDSVEIPDDIQFRTFLPDHYITHSDLAHLVTLAATQWVYGLALLNVIRNRSISAALDLNAGTTIGGTQLAPRSWAAVPSFTAASSVTVTMPNSGQLEDFDFMEVTWHTGVGTATDNANRNYTELGAVVAIIENSDAEVIMGGRGRGADNYGIEVTVPANGQVTTLAMDIVNLNDAAGAVLPAGSLITQVRFY